MIELIADQRVAVAQLAVVRAGIDRNFRWHDLRHAWASWHVQSGTRLQELMELGGWSSFDMVVRYRASGDRSSA
ncbi:MAG TPA: tyrosine-type recombinase/integrase [Rudaea sp.]|nr:tyrosine-type recombinase/integrase [Rudaea sp.]